MILSYDYYENPDYDICIAYKHNLHLDIYSQSLNIFLSLNPLTYSFLLHQFSTKYNIITILV